MSHLTGFESRQLTSPIRVNRLDGTQLGAELPKGWEGYFEVERGTSSLPSFFVTGQIIPGGLHLASRTSLLVAPVSNMRLHHAASRTVSLRVFLFQPGQANALNSQT